MKVFVTGATGFIGAEVVDELLRREHSVVGLARRESSADRLRDKGVDVVVGDVSDPLSICPVLGEVDAVIHLAFNHDFSRYEDHCAADGRLLDRFANALVGSSKPLVATSATTVTPAVELATEADLAAPSIPRSASEAFLEYAHQRVQTSVVRLPPTVHGEGDAAFVPALIALARRTGISAYMAEGENAWPAVHRKDAARLFCDVVERPQAGARYHAVAEGGIPFRDIAAAIGQGLGLAPHECAGRSSRGVFRVASEVRRDRPTCVERMDPSRDGMGTARGGADRDHAGGRVL
ncbi:MAG: NAD-dependent epimerase/dehydratase family protein [Myxococcota bacterium]